jgi:hypothetical protein
MVRTSKEEEEPMRGRGAAVGDEAVRRRLIDRTSTRSGLQFQDSESR